VSGGNVELKQLIKAEGQNRSSHFRFSVLEIADLHEIRERILRRESHWKSVLLSREHEQCAPFAAHALKHG
jgi:hypothetical protein